MRQSSGFVEVIHLTEKFTFNPKEGIDNPVMVITDDADSMPTPTPRLCVLKREEGGSFGFYLRLERGCRGHVIRNVTPFGVAERSGLRDGDRLLEVNNSFVDDISHPEVARQIKLSGPQLCLLVLDGEEYDWAVSQGQDLRTLARAHKAEGCKAPRLCHITRVPAVGLGINFSPVEGKKGRFYVNLVPGGPAEKAGVCKGDRLVWMNGAVVSDLTHSALSKMMKKCGDHITILVIDSESEQHYIQQKMPILPAMATSHNLPHMSRKLHLVHGPEGYGFLLRQGKTPSGRAVHVLHEVDSGSPAQRAGVREGDLLLEVDGESVESLKHEEIVERFRQSGQEVTITTIAARGLDFYTQLGLSPLLFCEQSTGVEEKKSSGPLPTVAEQVPKEGPAHLPSPRRCVVQKGPLGFGFNLGCVQHTPGTFISQVPLGGPGNSAGLQEGDVVMEVNGQNVEDKSLENVMMLVKAGGQFISMLVMDKSGYDKLKQNQMLNSSEVIASKEEETQELSVL